MASAQQKDWRVEKNIFKNGEMEQEKASAEHLNFDRKSQRKS